MYRCTGNICPDMYHQIRLTNDSHENSKRAREFTWRSSAVVQSRYCVAGVVMYASASVATSAYAMA